MQPEGAAAAGGDVWEGAGWCWEVWEMVLILKACGHSAGGGIQPAGVAAAGGEVWEGVEGCGKVWSGVGKRGCLRRMVSQQEMVCSLQVLLLQVGGVVKLWGSVGAVENHRAAMGLVRETCGFLHDMVGACQLDCFLAN